MSAGGACSQFTPFPGPTLRADFGGQPLCPGPRVSQCPRCAPISARGTWFRVDSVSSPSF
eukprot:11216479-Lingulodinium_polyedra.AAC.1